MRTPIISLFSALIMLGACADDRTEKDIITDVTEENSVFNPELAEALGADPYGMSSYVFVTLKTGPNDANITDKAERAELFKGHFDMIDRLAEEGKLVLAGPFVEAGEKRGLYIFDVETIEEAQELVKTDPSINAGIFIVEFDKYYGSAALRKVNEIHKTIQEKEM